MAIDTFKIQSQRAFPQFNISFDKSFNQMSPTERIIAATALQDQASQELALSKSKENNFFEKTVKFISTLR